MVAVAVPLAVDAGAGAFLVLLPPCSQLLDEDDEQAQQFVTAHGTGDMGGSRVVAHDALRVLRNVCTVCV